jgi:hypothetical protein
MPHNKRMQTDVRERCRSTVVGVASGVQGRRPQWESAAVPGRS